MKRVELLDYIRDLLSNAGFYVSQATKPQKNNKKAFR